MANSVYEQLRAADVPLDHHESDLYAKVTAASNAIIEGYRFRSIVTTFTSALDGALWYEIPFAYDPFWRGQ